MNDRDTPFFAGSILGLRAWVVRPHLPSSATRLGSAIAESTWAPGGEWTKAGCRPGGSWGGRHPAPQPGCSCGLYAYHPGPDSALALVATHVEIGCKGDAGETSLVEAVGVCGVVEASGRIEVHRSGFRAERARPLALVAAPEWPRDARDAVAELATLYGGEVLQVGTGAEIVEYCLMRGGVLDASRLDNLLGELEAGEVVDPTVVPPATPARSPLPRPASSPPPPNGRWDRIKDRAWTLLIVGLGTLWYGFWAVVVVSIAGAVLFGWFETEPKKLPARIESVEFDRKRCVVRASVIARRDLKHLDLRLAGRLGNGEGIGHFEKRLGPIERGRSWVVVSKPDPSACRSRHTYKLRVRPVWPQRMGAPADVRSVPLRQESPRDST